MALYEQLSDSILFPSIKRKHSDGQLYQVIQYMQ